MLILRLFSPSPGKANLPTAPSELTMENTRLIKGGHAFPLVRLVAVWGKVFGGKHWGWSMAFFFY
jgi:hypothetical protein